MSMKLYVGNLAFETTSTDLQTLFAQAGTVESASVMSGKDWRWLALRLNSSTRGPQRASALMPSHLGSMQ